MVEIVHGPLSKLLTITIQIKFVKTHLTAAAAAKPVVTAAVVIAVGASRIDVEASRVKPKNDERRLAFKGRLNFSPVKSSMLSISRKSSSPMNHFLQKIQLGSNFGE